MKVLAHPRIPVRVRIFLTATLLLAAVGGGGWLWLRDSSLVAIRQVSITGVSGRDAAAIATNLERAARQMTTLNVQLSRLRAAVAGYRQVRSLRISTSFPHALRIFVVEQVPVAILSYPGGRVPVDAEGEVLARATAARLPLIRLAAAPSGRWLHVGDGLEQVRLLAAAPWQMIGRTASVRFEGLHGLVAQLRHGPRVYFGAPQSLAAKWTALIAVLADPGSEGASYIDVSDPSHPAAGGGSAAAASAPPASAPGAGAQTTSTAAAPTATSATSTVPAPAGSTAPAAAPATTTQGAGGAGTTATTAAPGSSTTSAPGGAAPVGAG